MKRINEQKDFTAYVSVGGDLYIENSDGDVRLICSPNGSDEHEVYLDAILATDNDGLRSEWDKAAAE